MATTNNESRRSYNAERKSAAEQRALAIDAAASIFQHGSYKGEMKPVDKYDPRYNYKTYKYDYYSGAQAKVFFGDIWVDDVVTIQYTINQSKQPIYGYASQLFDAVAMGTVIGNGSLTIAFKETGYLNVIKNVLDKQRDAGRLAADNATFRLGVGGESAANTNGRGSNTLKTTSDYSAIINPNLTPSLLRRNETIEDILDEAVISKSVFGDNKGSVKDFEDVAEAYEDSIWGDSNGKIGNNFYQILRADQFDYKFDKNSTPYGVYCAEIDDYSKCLNIVLSFGDMNDQRAEHTLVVLNDVHFSGQGMIVSPDGQPLAETYEFFFRDINQTITRNTYKINEAKVNLSSSAQLHLGKVEEIEALINNKSATFTATLVSGFNSKIGLWQKVSGEFKPTLLASAIGVDAHSNDINKFYELIQDTFSYYLTTGGESTFDVKTYSKVLISISSNQDYLNVPNIILDQIIPGGHIFKVNASNDDFVALDLVRRSDFFDTELKSDMQKKIEDEISAKNQQIANAKSHMDSANGDLLDIGQIISEQTKQIDQSTNQLSTVNNSIKTVTDLIGSLENSLKNATPEQKADINAKLTTLKSELKGHTSEKQTLEDKLAYLASASKLNMANMQISTENYNNWAGIRKDLETQQINDISSLNAFIASKDTFEKYVNTDGPTITNLSNDATEVTDVAITSRDFQFLSPEPQVTSIGGTEITFAELNKNLSSVQSSDGKKPFTLNVSDKFKQTNTVSGYVFANEGLSVKTHVDPKGTKWYHVYGDLNEGKINFPGGVTFGKLDNKGKVIVFDSHKELLKKVGIDWTKLQGLSLDEVKNISINEYQATTMLKSYVSTSEATLASVYPHYYSLPMSVRKALGDYAYQYGDDDAVRVVRAFGSTPVKDLSYEQVQNAATLMQMDANYEIVAGWKKIDEIMAASTPAVRANLEQRRNNQVAGLWSLVASTTTPVSTNATDGNSSRSNSTTSTTTPSSTNASVTPVAQPVTTNTTDGTVVTQPQPVEQPVVPVEQPVTQVEQPVTTNTTDGTVVTPPQPVEQPVEQPVAPVVGQHSSTDSINGSVNVVPLQSVESQVVQLSVDAINSTSIAPQIPSGNKDTKIVNSTGEVIVTKLTPQQESDKQMREIFDALTTEEKIKTFGLKSMSAGSLLEEQVDKYTKDAISYFESLTTEQKITEFGLDTSEFGLLSEDQVNKYTKEVMTYLDSIPQEQKAKFGLEPIPEGTKRIADVYFNSVGMRDTPFSWTGLKEYYEKKYPGVLIRVNTSPDELLNNIKYNTPDELYHLTLGHGHKSWSGLSSNVNGIEDDVEFSAIVDALGEDKTIVVSCGLNESLKRNPQGPNLVPLAGIKRKAVVGESLEKWMSMTDSELDENENLFTPKQETTVSTKTDATVSLVGEPRLESKTSGTISLSEDINLLKTTLSTVEDLQNQLPTLTTKISPSSIITPAIKQSLKQDILADIDKQQAAKIEFPGLKGKIASGAIAVADVFGIKNLGASTMSKTGDRIITQIIEGNKSQREATLKKYTPAMSKNDAIKVNDAVSALNSLESFSRNFERASNIDSKVNEVDSFVKNIVKYPSTSIVYSILDKSKGITYDDLIRYTSSRTAYNDPQNAENLKVKLEYLRIATNLFKKLGN